jgi:small ligand-binding sensory domain FIST
MPFAAALSTTPDTERALAEVCTQALGQLGGPPELAVAFASPHHADDLGPVAAALSERLRPAHLIGCCGESIVGTGREVERQPAVSLWLAAWGGGVDLEPFHLTPQRTGDGLSLLGWPDGLLDADPARAAMLLLGDPFTFPAVESFLPRVNDDHRGLRVLGGMASGGTGPGRTPLFLGGHPAELGAVGVLLRGPIGLRSVVSQGCRPIGRHLVVTKAQDNVVTELGGRPPLERLQEMWEGLSPRDRALFQRGPHVGLVIDEYRDRFERGDFLVRNIYGVDQDSGALILTDRVRAGQTVQFHVRDAAAADEDLRALLRADGSAHPHRPGGALLFTCNGRGTRLFAGPDHDAGVLREELGELPVAGFFAAGELGPIGGRNFIHGFTASVALFE